MTVKQMLVGMIARILYLKVLTFLRRPCPLCDGPTVLVYFENGICNVCAEHERSEKERQIEEAWAEYYAEQQAADEAEEAMLQEREDRELFAASQFVSEPIRIESFGIPDDDSLTDWLDDPSDFDDLEDEDEREVEEDDYDPYADDEDNLNPAEIERLHPSKPKVWKVKSCTKCSKQFRTSNDSDSCYDCHLRRITGGMAPEEGDFNSAHLAAGDWTEQEEAQFQSELRDYV